MSDDEVGYGKPPKKHRFQKGQSGNPAGRRKGSRNISTMVDEALKSTVIINLNGKRKSVSKLEAAFMQQANKAAAGDPKATKLMLDIMSGAQTREDARAGGGEITTEARRAQEDKILAALRSRLGGEADE